MGMRMSDADCALMRVVSSLWLTFPPSNPGLEASDVLTWAAKSTRKSRAFMLPDDQKELREDRGLEKSPGIVLARAP